MMKRFPSMEFWFKPNSSQMWLSFSILLPLFIVFSTASASEISYSEHCSSIVPQSELTSPDFTSSFPSLRRTTTFFTGGDRFFRRGNSSSFDYDMQSYLSFRTTRNVYRTKELGIYSIEANLMFRSANWRSITEDSSYGGGYRNRTGSRRSRPLRFRLNGFWSEASEKLCMVGTAVWYSVEGKTLHLQAVLKLNYAKDLTIVNSLISGSLESLSSPNDPDYFESISILGYSLRNQYTYTLVSEQFDSGCPGGIDIPRDSSLSLPGTGVCSILSRGLEYFSLDYPRNCNSDAKNCTPFGGSLGYLPPIVSLNAIECSEDEQKLRYLINFPNSSYFGYSGGFDPNTTLVGEGSWDGKKNRLCIAACRILNVTDSWGNARVGDCSVRLSYRFPSVWSIKGMNAIVGQIWTNKTTIDLGYFDRITFQSVGDLRVGVPRLKYDYTVIDRVQKSCPVKKPGKNKKMRYPSGDSADMRFDMSITDVEGKFSWGYAFPVFMGDRFYEQYATIEESSVSANDGSSLTAAMSPIAEGNIGHSGPMNISYKVTFQRPLDDKLRHGVSLFNTSMNPNGRVEILAEGIYDPKTGYLCMVGCRKLYTYHQKSIGDNMDCDILLNFQFPPSNSKTGSIIKGSIESMRKGIDPLYFEHLNMSSSAFYITEATESIWRMDLEIIMVLISNTLACVFVGSQLFYVKKHPDVLPSNSIFMHVILTLGHMIPLVLNFEALFFEKHNRQDVLLGSGGWLEVNEVVVRVVKMVAFLLQIRLLQVAWSARSGEESQKGLWAAEKKALFVSLPLYIAGGLIALFVTRKKNKYRQVGFVSSSVRYQQQQHYLLEGIRSYGGLVLDGFLFPQILLNLFHSSRTSPLSHSFYIGTTSVRVLPHAYDLYRTHNYVPQHLNGSYIYANPTANFYSTAWDVIIPFGAVLFAVIIFLQQRFGGRSILPPKFRDSQAYEMVPIVSGK